MFKESIYKLNNLIEYIEQNLDSEIEYKTLAEILCVNEYTLHRVFYFITNISLSEYIRKRRLSNSCIDLLNGSKVIDVSIKYGYETATSFGRAFKKMMGFSPKDIKNNKDNLKFFPVLKFDKYDNFVEEIEYKILDNINFNLYAVSKTMPTYKIPDIISPFWEEILGNEEFIFKDKRYGIIEYDKFLISPKMATYYIASTYKFKGSKKYNIKNRSFLMFSIDSRNAQEISRFTKIIYACVIPYLGYNLDTVPDIEEYVGISTTNIYIPIIKK